ncbi:MAG: tRNA pseudouridine synthase [Actinomycetota bacterium]|jgi:tRNA pseudouridine55 synthase
MNGLLVLDKPTGMTSHDVVRIVRRALGTRKVGHAGTLDPMASGVLVLGIGRATRLLTYVVGVDKTYEATMLLGVRTNTDDADGEVTFTATAAELAEVNSEAIAAVAETFVGDIQQKPCAVSAIKVEGERAYALVRKGEEVDLPARPITIHELTIHHIERAADGYLVDFRVRCSSGTYVRALARDIGSQLNVGGHLVALRRTRVGPFDAGRAVVLGTDTSQKDLTSRLIPLDKAIMELMPTCVVTDDDAVHIRHGRPIAWPAQVEVLTALMSTNGTALALAEPEHGIARYRWVLSGANA